MIKDVYIPCNGILLIHKKERNLQREKVTVNGKEEDQPWEGDLLSRLLFGQSDSLLGVWPTEGKPTEPSQWGRLPQTRQRAAWFFSPLLFGEPASNSSAIIFNLAIFSLFAAEEQSQIWHITIYATFSCRPITHTVRKDGLCLKCGVYSQYSSWCCLTWAQGDGAEEALKRPFGSLGSNIISGQWQAFHQSPGTCWILARKR